MSCYPNFPICKNIAERTSKHEEIGYVKIKSCWHSVHTRSFSQVIFIWKCWKMVKGRVDIKFSMRAYYHLTNLHFLNRKMLKSLLVRIMISQPFPFGDWCRWWWWSLKRSLSIWLNCSESTPSCPALDILGVDTVDAVE